MSVVASTFDVSSVPLATRLLPEIEYPRAIAHLVGQARPQPSPKALLDHPLPYGLRK